MATINYQIIGKKEKVNIYLRLTIKRGSQFRVKTGFIIDKNDWSSKTGLPFSNRDTDLKELTTTLKNLKNSLWNNLNKAESEGVIIDKNWAEDQINLIKGKKEVSDPDRLVNYFQTYIDELPFKRANGSTRPITKATITKYKTIQTKISDLEKFRKKPIFIKDVDLSFRKEFIDYLINNQELSENTVGRYITVVKTVCRDAGIKGFQTHHQLEAIKGFTNKVTKIYFTFEELKRISTVKLESESLDNARDWLVLGCYIGQRGGDLLNLTHKNISTKGKNKTIELTQEKTSKNIIIPIKGPIEEILKKRNGNFPRPISTQKFNEYIKKVALAANFTEPTEGSVVEVVKIDGKNVQRKKYGTHPKYKLVTSHICRRSFASNHYGEMYTSSIIAITGHSTEQQFLDYVGKPPIDHTQQIADQLETIYNKHLNG
nr:phage integrase SAM-like domain-containing protein [uncultured Carboxylicivirga sp.]